MADIATNFIFGGISGATGVLISHPFDTIKTHLQNNQVVKYDFKTLYKGIKPPLFGVGFEKAVVFGVYESSKSILNGKLDNNTNIFLSGAIAGLSASFVVTPFERFKILAQLNKNSVHSNFNIQNLFTGLSATFTRETLGFAIYFTIFENLKNNRKLMPHESFMYGAISGLGAWLLIYPQDRIKTIMQSNLHNTNNFIGIAKTILNTEGFAGFYKGFSFALLRAIPLHAGTFMTMEILKNCLFIKN